MNILEQTSTSVKKAKKSQCTQDIILVQYL